MRLKDVESKLPNGFHDAKINTISRNLKEELVEIHLDILSGLPDDERDRQNEVRQGVLRIKGAKIVVVEEPDVDSPFAYPGSVNFVLTEDEPGSIADSLLKKLNCECHTYTFFIQEWLSNVKIVATDLEFTWS